MANIEPSLKSLKDAFYSELSNCRGNSLDVQSALNCFDTACNKVFALDFNNEDLDAFSSEVQLPTALLNSELDEQSFELTINDIDSIQADLNEITSSKQLIDGINEYLRRRPCPHPPCPRPRNIVLTPETLEELLKLLS